MRICELRTVICAQRSLLDHFWPTQAVLFSIAAGAFAQLPAHLRAICAAVAFSISITALSVETPAAHLNSQCWNDDEERVQHVQPHQDEHDSADDLKSALKPPKRLHRLQSTDRPAAEENRNGSANGEREK